MMSYEALLNDLESLQKSYAVDPDDKAIQAQAAEARGEDGDKQSDDEDADELDEGGEPIVKKKGKPFGKSFTLVGEDGAETEAIDGTEMVKSLYAEVHALTQSAESEKGELSKSIQILTDVIKSQGVLIKSLQDNYASLANQGAGRKSVTAPTAAMAKSLQPALNTETFMMKANAAYNAGRITGKDLTVCDVSLRHNEAIDASLINKIFVD